MRTISRLNGRPAITFAVMKSKGASDVEVLKLVEAEIEKVSKEYGNVKIARVFTTVELTKRTYRTALEALIEGSLLAVAVVWLFLRDLRATAISALAIPLSAIPTFAFMDIMGFTLNQISLLALSLVAGVLVDDAIVEIENIVRHMHMGKSGYQAALDAADQIGLAVVATSSAIIAVFLPVSFMGGIIGQFFKQFGLTVAAAVFFSLLVARLLTPVIAAYTLKSDHKVHADGPVMTVVSAAAALVRRAPLEDAGRGRRDLCAVHHGVLFPAHLGVPGRTTATVPPCPSSCRRAYGWNRPQRSQPAPAPSSASTRK